MSALIVPKFVDCRHPGSAFTASGARLTGYSLGPRWCKITLDRVVTRLIDGRWPEGPSREVMAALADDLAILFVHSHTAGSTFVSTFTGDYVHLHTPRRIADLMVATLVCAELGDLTLARIIAPVVAETAATLQRGRTRADRRRIAGGLVDDMAARLLEVTRW